jgi:hypothetical protein
MPWKSQGEKRKCEERKGTGSREKEKEKDGNGKNERIYPLENILFDTNIERACCHCSTPFLILQTVCAIIYLVQKGGE